MNLSESKKKIVMIGVIIVMIIVTIVIGIVVLGGGRKDEKKEEPQTPSPTATQTPTDEPTGTPMPTATQEPTKEPEPTATPVPLPKDMNRLTGEKMDEELAAKRPIAIMINNIKAANPQSGTSQADVIYECNAEGGITRMMCLFQTIGDGRFGSIRSVRHYFASFANEYDAIFVSVGGSKAGVAKLDELKMDYMNGVTGIGTVMMFQDKSIKRPHNCFTTKDHLKAAIEKKGFRTDFQGKTDNHWQFYDENITPENGKAANKVTVKMSGYTSPYFVYKESDGLYYRYQFGGPHIDKVTGTQLKFKNVIVMYVVEHKMDDYGRQDMEIEDNSGKGFFITNGTSVPITWKKNEKANTMQFLDSNGELLHVNRGKTFIMVVPDTLVDGTRFE